MINVHNASAKELWDRAGEALISEISGHEKVLVFLSGGSAITLYPKLTEFIKMKKPSIALAQVDERFQPESGESVNAYDIGRTNLWKVCEELKVPTFLVSQEGTLEEAAAKYNEIMKPHFVPLNGTSRGKQYEFKIAILGIGPDCHTAGLLPGYAKVWNTLNLAAGYENNGLYPKRITLTPKALSELEMGIVVVSGEGKKEALANASNKKNLKDIDQYPATIMQQMEKVELFTDISFS